MQIPIRMELEVFEDTTKAKNIISVLEKRGYSKEDIEKICYKNFYRVIKEIINK